MNIYEKLLNIQNELKAPKNQFNKFGNYKYRNAEDILEAVKPICLKYKALLRLFDRIVQVGDRYYVEAVALLTDIEKPTDFIENCSSAREEENKKGMDSSQVTGATSSYARKYALNGLLCIDDTKDTDTEEYQKQDKEKRQAKPNVTVKNKEVMITEQQKEIITRIYTSEEIKEYLINTVKKGRLSNLTLVEASEFIKKKEEKKEGKEENE